MDALKKAAKLLRAAALPAIAALTVISLVSCSVIQINYEKFGLGTTAPSTSGGDGTSSRNPSDAEETTEFTPPDEYKYTGKEKAEALLSEINFDFGGESVFIMTTNEDEISRILSFSDEEDNTYSAAKYDRCRMVEEKLNCKLRYVTTTVDEMIVELKASVDSGEYYADLLAIPGSDLASLAREGLLLNMNSLAFLDIGAEYFEPSTTDLSAGNSAFAVTSYATVDPDEISCVFYDTSKVTDDICALVRSGNWTWDEFFRIDGESGISADAIAGDDGENIVDTDWLTRNVIASAGLKFVSNERGSAPSAILPDGVSYAADVCRTLLGDSRVGAGVNLFASGQSVFHIGTLSNMEALANIDVVWDIAPLPKMSPSQEKYASAMPESSLLLAAPVNTTNPDGVSALVRALAASSYGYLKDAYIEYHMYNTVRRESTLEMLDIIYGTADYEIADVFGTVSDEIYDVSGGLVADAVENSDADIEKLFEDRREDADSALEKLFGRPARD